MKKSAVLFMLVVLTVLLAACHSHVWEDATCSAPKTCSECGETEGEALPHTMSEASYQSAATCEVCGITEGEPLTAFFEEKGYLLSDLDTECDYITVSYNDSSVTQTNQIVFSDYRVIDSDESLPAKDGYEWRVVQVSFLFDDPTVAQYGYRFAFTTVDYYTGACYNDDYFSVHYNGVDYSECVGEAVLNVKQWLPGGDTAEVVYTKCIQVPVGYDGIVVAAVNAGAYDLENKPSNVTELEDMSPVFFRMD